MSLWSTWLAIDTTRDSLYFSPPVLPYWAEHDLAFLGGSWSKRIEGCRQLLSVRRRLNQRPRSEGITQLYPNPKDRPLLLRRSWRGNLHMAG
jgi:hypothetical protein